MDKKISTQTSALPQIESLLKVAFTRTKERVLSYFLTMLLSWAIIIGFFIVAVLIGVALAGLLSTLHNPFLTMGIALVGGIGGYLLFIYLTVWLQLAIVRIFMNDKVSATEAMKEVRPLVWGFVGYSLLLALFFIGLLPISILTVFIILMLWGVWSSFSVFVYIDYQKKGLQNLWLSRAIINQNFWGVVLRLILVYIGFYFIIFALGVYGRDSGLAGILLFLISIFAGPFIMSYMYEMYNSLKKDIDVKTPMVWVVLSVLGGILLVLGLFSLGSMASKELPNLMRDLEKTAPNNKMKMMPSGYPGMNIDTKTNGDVNININGKQVY